MKCHFQSEIIFCCEKYICIWIEINEVVSHIDSAERHYANYNIHIWWLSVASPQLQYILRAHRPFICGYGISFFIFFIRCITLHDISFGCVDSLSINAPLHKFLLHNSLWASYLCATLRQAIKFGHFFIKKKKKQIEKYNCVRSLLIVMNDILMVVWNCMTSTNELY